MLFKKKNKEKIFFENDNHIVSHSPSYYLNRVQDSLDASWCLTLVIEEGLNYNTYCLYFLCFFN